MCRKVSEAYRRWRHTRGYGVHSPFAYEVVKGAVRPGKPYRYYAYEDIDNALESDNRRRYRREARLLLRLAAFLGARSAFIPQHTVNAFRIALLGADSRMKVNSSLSEAADCDLVCSNRDYVPLDTLRPLLADHRKVLLLRRLPEGWREKLFDFMTDGLMLYGKENAIIIPREGMQKVAYSMCI